MEIVGNGFYRLLSAISSYRRSGAFRWRCAGNQEKARVNKDVLISVTISPRHDK